MGRQKLDGKSIDQSSIQFETTKFATKMRPKNYKTADIEKHNYNPDKIYNKDLTEQLSEHKYKQKPENYTVVLDTPELMRLKEQRKYQSDNSYRTRPKDAFKGIGKDSIEIAAQAQAQDQLSDQKYKDAIDRRPAFAKLTSTPAIDHQKDVA